MMTPSERLYTAVSGGVPDRVPFVPKIWIDLAARLLGEEILEVAGDPGRALMATARAAMKLNLDGARLFHLPARRFRSTEDGQVIEVDSKGCRVGTVDVAGGLATELDDAASFDLRDPADVAFAQFKASAAPFVKNVADVRAMAVPDLRFWEECGAIRRTREAIATCGDKVALIGDLGSATLSFCAAFRGMQRTLFDLIDEPKIIHALMDKSVEIAIERARFNIDAGLKILRLNDSAGNMNLISPAAWREFVFPRFRDIVAVVKAYDSRARIYCHICGNIVPIARDLVETGMDCIGPLDPLGGSTPGIVRAIVGSGTALMGGIDTLSLLNGTTESVAREARGCMEAGGLRGAFVLGSGCVAPRGSPEENLLAAMDAARKWGVYENGTLCGGVRRQDRQ